LNWGDTDRLQILITRTKERGANERKMSAMATDHMIECSKA
jgi:hypothetical protein